MKKNLLSVFFTATLLMSGCAGTNNSNNNSNGNTTNSSTNVSSTSKVSSVTSTSEERPAVCTVTFDLMYNNKTREVEVKNGNKATAYNPKRSGFTLMGWYTEKEFKNKFDFDTPITNHLTLYANWMENAKVVKYDVTFDLNYGSAPDVTIKVIEGQKITATDVPEVKRLGYELIGWYTTEDCQEGTEFDVEYDVVTGPLTLYAGYEKSTDLDVDEEGNIEYTNVSVNFAINESFGIKNSVQKVVDKFNTEYTGQIRINVVDQSKTDNSLITLKFHQTEVINYSGDYHDMQDVLDLAGIEFDATNYYASQIADSYKDGKLKTMPIGSFVPVVAYNKALMTKYTDGNVPTTGTEWYSLLEEVQDGESKSNTNWLKAATISTEWEMKEISSHAAYIQNGAPFYEMNEEGKLVNTWLDSAENKANAETSFKQLRKYFSADSTVGTVNVETGWGKAQEPIGTGNAFVSVLGTPTLFNTCGNLIGKTDASLTNDVGIAPLSNFFAANPESEDANKVLVKSFALGITDSGPDDLMKKAAAAVFADYLTKNSGLLTEKFVYPAHKVVQEEVLTTTALDWRIQQVLLKSGSPENFMTYPGHISEYAIFNHYNEELIPLLLAGGVDDAMITGYVDSMSSKITSTLA